MYSNFIFGKRLLETMQTQQKDLFFAKIGRNFLGANVLSVIKQLLIVFSVMLVLVSCQNTAVVSDRSQREANEIVSLLHRHGIEANVVKETGGRGRYGVFVDSAQSAVAISLMTQFGYPKENEGSVSELLMQRSLLPNSRDVEALRLDYALALELEGQLRNLPGVSVASVIVRVRFKPIGESAGVSVIVQHRLGAEVAEDLVRNLVLQSIPGLKRDAILVTIKQEKDKEESLNELSSMPVKRFLGEVLGGVRVAASDHRKLTVVVGVVMVIFLLAGMLIGYLYGIFKSQKNSLESESLDMRIRPSLRLDRGNSKKGLIDKGA